MSNYTKLTRHPNTGQYHISEWKDDYFGKHKYGVKFPEDKVVYPAEQVVKAQLQTLWFDDVIKALEVENIGVLTFLDDVETAYKARWERDPTGGEGARKWLRDMRYDSYFEGDR